MTFSSYWNSLYFVGIAYILLITDFIPELENP